MLLKKAGMVVLGAAAGVAALSGTAFAGDMPSSTGHDHGHHHHGPDRDRDRDRGGDIENSAVASNGDCANFGDQLVGVNCTNVQAPINGLGVLSSITNVSDSGSRADNGDGRSARGDNGGDIENSAVARNGDSYNFGDQLIGLNGTNVQAPINNIGILSEITNI